MFVRNDTPQSGYPYPVSVKYLHPVETVEITKDVLRGGTKVTSTIIGHNPTVDYYITGAPG